MSLYQEVRLYTNASQREAFDNRAELYSIIKTIQELEVNGSLSVLGVSVALPVPPKI